MNRLLLYLPWSGIDTWMEGDTFYRMGHDSISGDFPPVIGRPKTLILSNCGRVYKVRILIGALMYLKGNLLSGPIDH